MDSQCSTKYSSDLSSVGSLSPPPPGDYPSPASSQESIASLSESLPLSNKHPREGDDLPPTKKRKIFEAKPRTTQILDLQAPDNSHAPDQKAPLALLLKGLRKRRKIVVIAGAGISVSAGVPDFRSSTGLFSTLRSEHKVKASGKHLFDASVYQTDSSTSSFHDMVRSLSKLVRDAEPTAFHQMLATLANEGRLMRLYTQNVDGIDTSLPPLVTSVPLSMKGPWPRTIQLHGGLEKMVCSKCNHLSDFDAALFEGPSPPPCTACIEIDKVRTDHAGKRSHGIGRLRPRIVLYNEHNPDEEAIGTVVSADLRTRPDAVIVVGTSMKIPGVRRIVREMCGVVRGRRDGLTVWVNHEPPPVGKEFEDCFDLVVKGACDEVAFRAAMKRWDDNSVDYKICTDSDAERAKAKDNIAVVIHSPTKKRFNSSILTPTASPRPKSSKLHPTKLKLTAPNPAKIVQKEHLLSKLAKVKANKLTLNPKPASKKSSSAKPPAVSAVTTHKITSSFKITKPATQQQALAGKKSKPVSTRHQKRFGTTTTAGEPSTMPMGPISPQAARNNGPVASSTKPIFPNLKRRSGEIVSPTGAIPSGMEALLH